MMKKLTTILMVLLLALSLAACGGKDSGEEPAEEEQQTETVETVNENVVKTFDEIDTEDMQDLPLQIESVTLLDDGTVRIVPTDDLLKIAETNNEVKDGAIYPFADSGKVKDMYLVRFGNGGYRTIICLMDDGSLSALSAKELIEDRIAVVMDNVSGRDNYVSVKQEEYEDSFGVIGITEDDEEVELDFSLNF